MRRLRLLSVSVGLPLAFLAAVFWAMLPERPQYVLAAPTVVTVTDKGGPALLHAPETIYPAQALHDRVEGMVTLHIQIDSAGRVAKAEAVSGPAALVRAATDAVMQYQYVAEATETDVVFPFSLAHPGPRTFAVPQPLQRVTPANSAAYSAADSGRVRGVVRMVAVVTPEGRAEEVVPVSGPKELLPPAMESVRQWRFRPALRNGVATHGTAVVDVAFR